MKDQVVFANNRDGWALELHHYHDPETLDPSRKPVLMVPGYCMNTFILNYHPGGDSMVRYLVRQGFEVWTANLRGQGGSRKNAGNRRFGFRELALIDIPVALETVQRRTLSESERVDVVGCSLGGTFLFAYLAHHLDTHPVGAMITLGGPLRWEKTHRLLQIAFASADLAGAVRVAHTRRMARFALPIARKVPALLSLYMNTDHIDLDHTDELVKTVDDPIPYLNRQIAHWISTQDLYVAGVNVTAAMRYVDVPLLAIAANRDGIVPPATAMSAVSRMGTADVERLLVGDDDNWFAHADLFINDEAEPRVFEPMAQWLLARN